MSADKKPNGRHNSVCTKYDGKVRPRVEKETKLCRPTMRKKVHIKPAHVRELTDDAANKWFLRYARSRYTSVQQHLRCDVSNRNVCKYADIKVEKLHMKGHAQVTRVITLKVDWHSSWTVTLLPRIYSKFKFPHCFENMNSSRKWPKSCSHIYWTQYHENFVNRATKYRQKPFLPNQKVFEGITKIAELTDWTKPFAHLQRKLREETMKGTR